MKDKIKFEDIFDLTDIEKTFEQAIEYDLLKLMENGKMKKRPTKKTTINKWGRRTHKGNSKKSIKRRITKDVK